MTERYSDYNDKQASDFLAGELSFNNTHYKLTHIHIWKHPWLSIVSSHFCWDILKSENYIISHKLKELVPNSLRWSSSEMQLLFLI